MAFQAIQYPLLLELIATEQFGFALESLEREEGPTGAELGAQDGAGNTALHLAIQKNNAPLVRLLLKKTFPAQRKIQNRAGLSALDFLQVAPLDLIESLLSDTDLCEGLKEIWPCILLRACQAKKTEFALHLIRMKVDVNFVEEPTQNTPLHYAAEHDSADLIAALLRAGAKQDAENTDGIVPIRYLRRNKDLPTNQFALRVFANHAAMAEAESNSAGLLYAAEVNDAVCVHQFLEHGAHCGWSFGTGPQAGYFALHFAVFHKNEELIHLLIRRRANLHEVSHPAAPAPRGPSVFEVAIDAGFWDAFLILSEYKSDVSGLIDETRQTKLLQAIAEDPNRERAKQIARALIQMGFDSVALQRDEWPDLLGIPASVDRTSEDLYRAAADNNAVLVTALLKKKVPARQEGGEDAILIAVKNQHWNAVAAFAEFTPLGQDGRPDLAGRTAYGKALIAVLQAESLSRNEKLDIAKKLVSAGATFDQVVNKQSVLDGAVDLNDPDFFTLLMKKGCTSLQTPNLSVIERWLDDEALRTLLKPALPFLLFRACRQPKIPLALKLIAMKVDVNFIETSLHCTPLHQAAHHASADLITALLKAGAKQALAMTDRTVPIQYLPLKEGSRSQSALRAFSDHAELAENKLKQLGLLYAAEINAEYSVCQFLEQGLDFRGCCSVTGPQAGYFALHFAVFHKNEELIHLLIRRGAHLHEVNHPAAPAPRGPSVFEVAIDGDYWQAFSIFGEYQCDVTGLIDEGHKTKLLSEGVLTPALAEQLVQIHFDLTEILLAGIQLKNPGIIHIALNAGIFYQHDDRALLEAQALSAAEAAGFQAEWESILAAGYLGKAQLAPDVAMGQALLDCLKQDSSQNREEKISAALRMIRANADLSCTDSDTKNTALHYAASQGLHELIEPLIRHGADPALRNAAQAVPFSCLAESQLATQDLCRNAFDPFRESKRDFGYGAALLFTSPDQCAQKIWSTNPKFNWYIDSRHSPYSGMNLLQVVAKLNRKDLVLLLLQKQFPARSDVNLKHAILIAVESAAWEALSTFSEFVVTTDADKKAYGQALIQLLSSGASDEDKKRIGRQLIVANADLSLVEAGGSALDLAHRSHFTDLAELLQRKNAVSTRNGDGAALRGFAGNAQNVHDIVFVLSVDRSLAALSKRYGPVNPEMIARSVEEIRGKPWGQEEKMIASIARITDSARKFRGATNNDEALHTSRHRDDLDIVLHIVWMAAKEHKAEENIASMLRDISGGLCYTGVLTRLVQALEHASPLVVLTYPGSSPQQLMERRIHVLLAEQFFLKPTREQTEILLSWGDAQAEGPVPSSADAFRADCKILIKRQIQEEFGPTVTSASLDTAISQIDEFPIPKSVHLGLTSYLEAFQQIFNKPSLQQFYQARIRPALLAVTTAGGDFDALHQMLTQWHPLFSALNAYGQAPVKVPTRVRDAAGVLRPQLIEQVQAYDLPFLPEIIAARIPEAFNVEQAPSLCDALKKLAELGGRFKALYPSLFADAQTEMAALWQRCKAGFLKSGVIEGAFEKELNALTAKEEAVKRGDLLIARYRHRPFTLAIYEMLQREYQRLKAGADIKSLTDFVVSLEQNYRLYTETMLVFKHEAIVLVSRTSADFFKRVALLHDLHECGKSLPGDPAIQADFKAFAAARKQLISQNPVGLERLAPLFLKLHVFATSVCEALAQYPKSREDDKAAIFNVIIGLYASIKNRPKCSAHEVIGLMVGAQASLAVRQYAMQTQCATATCWRPSYPLADALDAAIASPVA